MGGHACEEVIGVWLGGGQVRLDEMRVHTCARDVVVFSALMIHHRLCRFKAPNNGLVSGYC